jgi:hypothetical protein
VWGRDSNTVLSLAATLSAFHCVCGDPGSIQPRLEHPDGHSPIR